MKNHFKENLIMTQEEEENFQSSNICWICEKLIDDEKVRGHCHIAEKYGGATHWSCNVNLKLTKNVFIIFHNLKGYGSHLIMNVINEFDVNVCVIPNGLEKYIAFKINKKFLLTVSNL